jgi:hypothetical protein
VQNGERSPTKVNQEASMTDLCYSPTTVKAPKHEEEDTIYIYATPNTEAKAKKKSKK